MLDRLGSRKHPWRQERKKYKISVHYESTEVKQTVAAPYEIMRSAVSKITKSQYTTKAQKSNKPCPPARRTGWGKNLRKKKGRPLFTRPSGGRPRFVWFLCFRSVLIFYFIFFPDVRDVFGIRGAQAWESTFRLLRMNVQGCHYILAIWFTCRFEDHDGFRPGAPSHFSFFLLVFKVKIPECFFLIDLSSPLNAGFGHRLFMSGF